jgi:hypothetical protein
MKGVGLKMIDREKKVEPSLAPGMDDNEDLQQEASEQEIKDENYTSVTTLSLDEVDPS